MKRLLLAFFFPVLCFAQGPPTNSNPLGGNLTVQDAGTCSTFGSFLWQHLPSNASTTTVNLAGTFSGTLTIRLSNNGGGSWTTNNTTTSAGTTSISTNGFTDICADVTTFTSGSFAVTITTGLNTGPVGPQGPPGSSSGGGGANSVGPVINAQNPSSFGGTVGFSTFVGDNTTAMAQLIAGSNAAAFASAGGIAFKTGCANQGNTITTLNCVISIAPGDFPIIFFENNHPSGQTIACIDTGGNVYTLLNPQSAGGSGDVRVYAPAVPVGLAATSITCTDSPAETYTISVANYTGVGAIGLHNFGTWTSTGTSTAPANTQTTQDANNFLVTGIAWLSSSGTTTLAANVGNLRASTNISGLTNAFGGAVIDNTAASASSIVTSGTLSASVAWAAQTVELRSGKYMIPTVYFPPGHYAWSSGFAPTKPTTFYSDGGGAQLDYTGTAHVVDVGPAGLTTTNYQFDPYTFKGITFTGGLSSTQGFFLNNLVLKIIWQNNYFLNFGPTAASGGFGINGNQGENDEVFFEDNYIWQWDNVQRNFMSVGGSGNAAGLATQAYIKRNNAICANGRQGGGGCAGTAAGSLFTVAGAENLIESNDLAFWCPDITVASNSGGYSTKIDKNNLEGPTGGGCAELIAYQTSDQLRIINNFFNVNNITNPIAPLTGSDLAQNMLVAWNAAVTMPNSTALVKENNLASQTGNLAFANMCSTGAGSGSTPCPILHTAGGNITQWNGDYAGQCTLVNPTGCPAYSFISPYSVAPKCTASWNGSGTLTGLLKATSTTTTLTITSTVTTDTGVINWQCSVDAQ